MSEKTIRKVIREELTKANEKTRVVSIQEASKLFDFPRDKLYRLVDEGKVPYIELENLSGSKRKVINTRTFDDWLNNLAKEHKTI